MKGAIFDLDGTIADSVGVWKKVDDKVLGRYGIKVDEKYRQAIKMLTYRECVEYIANNFNTGKTADELDKEFTKEAIYEYKAEESNKGIFVKNETKRHKNRNSYKQCKRNVWGIFEK